MTEILQGKLKVYRSSAGSGKTYTLAKEYIKLLLTNREVEREGQSENYFRHILAITFTNDAANEMKERVLQYLKEFSDLKEGEKHNLLEQIRVEINTEYPKLDISFEQIKIRSKVILQSILHRFSEFNIQTIDSFTNQIGRSFSRELGLPGNYEIYLDTGVKLSESVDLMLSQIDEKEQLLLKWLSDFVKNRIEEDKSWNVSYNLKDFSATLTDERVYELLETLKGWELEDFESVRKEISKNYAALISTCKKLAKEGLEYLYSEDLDYQDLKYKGNSVKSLFIKNIETPFDKDLGKNLYKSLQNNDWLDAKAIPKNDSYDDVNTNISIYAGKMHEFFEDKKSSYVLLKNILSNFYEMALLNKIKGILEELKQKDDQAFLSDLNEKIRNVVLNEPIPFIYEKAGVRYKHLLIDEFQDTSVFQWVNLIPLISNALANGNVNLIVGDVKQSIYRWRGADPDILVNLPESKDELKFLPIRDHVKAWEKMIEINQLDSNWRSKPGIVAFNNDFFEWLKDNNDEYPGLGHYYDDVVQNPKKEGNSDIRIDILPEKDFVKKEDMQTSKGELVIDYINHCKEKGYAWRDMAILCRRNEDIRRISEHLINNKISIISDESLLLNSSTPVKILIIVFNFLNEPGNQEICADLFLNISNYRKREVQNWTSLKGSFKVKSSSEFIEFITEFFGIENDLLQLEEGTVYQIAQAWIRALNLNENKNQQIYLDYFLDVLFDHSAKPDSGLSQFLEYWEDKKEKLSISSTRDQNAVRILTIHKAKGLEYPVVIIPYPELSYSLRSGSKVWVEIPDDFSSELPVAVLDLKKDLEDTIFEKDYTREKNAKFIEEVNALYVAFTRSEERLYIIGSAPAKQNMSNYLVDYVKFKDLVPSTDQTYPFEFESFFIEKNDSSVDGGISTTVDPWNNSQYQRSRFNRNLRWSVDFTLSKEQIDKIETGKAFHLLMSFFKTEKDLSKIIQMSSNLYKQKEDFEKFKSFINKIISDIEIKSYYQENWKIYTEKAILYQGEFLRPDRFQVKGKEIVLIDYKTGQPDEKHSQQVINYEKGLKDIYPDFRFRKFLMYTNPFKFISVS